MRALILTAALAACAPPALAQTSLQDLTLQAEIMAQQQLLQQRTIGIENQLMAMEARQRAEQGIATVEAQKARPYIPVAPVFVPSVAAQPAPSPGLVSIPDDRLAASNAAVRQAQQPRR
ncbi:hypothetical protein [Phenylobacterium sp.]|uniref:hypothetical protein n=1 Tax=Phenylobacterium sp. TaxID=1871053 RepID=UPI002F92ABA2